MKKIALFHFAYPPNIGGVENVVQQHAHVLADLGFEVSIYTGSGSEERKDIKLVEKEEFSSLLKSNPNLQEKILEKGIVDEEFYAHATKITKLLEEFLKDQDVVIVHNMLSIHRNLPFVYAFKQYAGKNPDKKIFAWVHDHAYLGSDGLKTQEAKNTIQEELLLTPIPQITYVAISHTLQDMLISLMPGIAKKIVVIPNGLLIKQFLGLDESLWTFIEQYSLLNAFPIILTPANLVERKNILYMLDIVGNLHNKFPNLLYIISGNPSIHRKTEDYYLLIKKKIHELGLSDVVLLLSDIRAQNPMWSIPVKELYRLVDCILYFSTDEKFGLPLLEAALSKTPIFTSNLPVFKEVLGDVHRFDHTKTKAESVADSIEKYISGSESIQLHKKTRQEYDLKKIIEEKLLPLL